MRGTAGRAWAAAASAIFGHLFLLGVWQIHVAHHPPAVEPEGEGAASRIHLYPPVVSRAPSNYDIVKPVQSGLPSSLENLIPEPVPDAVARELPGLIFEPVSGPVGEAPSGITGPFDPGGATPISIEQKPGPTEFIPVEQEPSVIRMPAPIYPELARAAEVDGRVRLRVLIGKDGKVEAVIVLEGHPMLNDAAIDAARRSVWRPALQQHRPVAVWVEMPMLFSLR